MHRSLHFTESTPRPRLCVLKKEEGEAYGFHLRVEWVKQGHIIRNVVSGGIAGRCGLEDGDRLLEVNNVYVEDAPHQEVNQRIKLSGHHLCLLVLDGDAYEKATAKGHDLRDLVKAYKGEDLKPPRLCHITRDPVLGLGMKFTPFCPFCHIAEKGCFSVSLVPGGAAEKAGVLKGDRLVWMNGAVMKKCGKYITILVIDSKSEKKSKKLELDLAPEGYGFLLRFEKVDTGSPAERAGIRDGDVLLEVNGESVELLQHDEIVTRVRESGRHISLTTVIPQGHEFYTQVGFLLHSIFYFWGVVNTTTASTTVSWDLHQSSRVEYHLSITLHEGNIFFSLGQVAPGSPGKKAGLRMGDIVIEVNGQNVEDQYLEDVIMLVKEGGPCLSLLVKDKEGYDDLKKSEELSSTASEVTKYFTAQLNKHLTMITCITFSFHFWLILNRAKKQKSHVCEMTSIGMTTNTPCCAPSDGTSSTPIF
uniref:NHERF family PDZ scaffold protein 4b n=1 Tax=Hippocampus comes TaxID=109280 RepID=A0A3Q2YWW3_HIPCM